MGKPVTESNLSLCVPAQIPAVLRGRQGYDSATCEGADSGYMRAPIKRLRSDMRRAFMCDAILST